MLKEKVVDIIQPLMGILHKKNKRNLGLMVLINRQIIERGNI